MQVYVPPKAYLYCLRLTTKRITGRRAEPVNVSFGSIVRVRDRVWPLAATMVGASSVVDDFWQDGQ